MISTIQRCLVMFFFLPVCLASAQTTITAAEYFFDSDPGVGNGIPLSITPGSSINTTVDIPASNLTPGFHFLFIRCKDNQNIWGIAEQRSVYIETPAAPVKAPLVAAEYFYAQDPGLGNGIPLPISKTDSLNVTTNFVLPDFPAGTTSLSIRVRDSTGQWSIAEGRSIEVVCKPILGNDTTVNTCNGAPADITNVFDYQNYASFQWNTPTPSAVTAGNYRLIVTSTLGCSDTAVVRVREFDAPTISANGPTTFCPGGSVRLTATPGSSYLWTTGATTRSITVSSGGNYTVTVTNSSGCAKASATTVLTVTPNPTPSISSSGSTTDVCPGRTVTLDAGAGYTTYLWSTGATTRTIVVSAAGSYSVTVTNATGCSGTSAPTVVTYQGCPKPTNPVNSNITATSARLSWTPPASCAIGYQLQYRQVNTTAWTTLQFANSSRNITGLLPNTTYEWRVQTGCQQTPPIGSGNISGPNFTTLSAAIAGAGMKQSTGGGLKAILFPNPARDVATIQLSGVTGSVSIRVTDMTGKTVWQSPASTARQLQVPVAQLSRGTYLVTVIGAAESTVLKLVKE